ncbi:hypothetical protein BT93_D1908 [Corymbia citriodora subsp. variegata]|nr:hypothetical protein BT93_D1908 [Corymbia citriodora subsp. variegata]
MASKSVSLVIIFLILLGSHCLLSRLSAARTLTDDDHNKIGASGSTPTQDSSWSGSSSPSGNKPQSPPTTVGVAYKSVHAGAAACSNRYNRTGRYTPCMPSRASNSTYTRQGLYKRTP